MRIAGDDCLAQADALVQFAARVAQLSALRQMGRAPGMQESEASGNEAPAVWSQSRAVGTTQRMGEEG